MVAGWGEKVDERAGEGVLLQRRREGRRKETGGG